MTQPHASQIRILLSALLLAACADEEDFQEPSTEEPSVDEELAATALPADTRFYWDGDVEIAIKNCAKNPATAFKVDVVLAGYEEFNAARRTRRAVFESCVQNAPLVETGSTLAYFGHVEDCALQLDRRPIIDGIVNAKLVEISCANLNPTFRGVPIGGGSGRAAARAGKQPDGRVFIKVDNKYLEGRPSPSELAAVFAHEITHNRGYSHSLNPNGSPLYDLTIPVQVQACVERQAANPAPAGFVEAKGLCATLPSSGSTLWYVMCVPGGCGQVETAAPFVPGPGGF